MKSSYRVLEARVAPRDRDLALGLLYQAGLGTVLTTRTRKELVLQAQLASGDRSAPSRLRSAEFAVPRRIFRKLRVRAVARGAWTDHYQKFLKPFDLLPAAAGWPALRVDPRDRASRRPKPDILAIKASLAFGTGTHATTQLAAHYLREALKIHDHARVLDMGCGTSILAMTAVRCGAKSVVAVDDDPEALAISRENLDANRIRGVALRASLPHGRARFDIVVANITAPVLITLHDELVLRLKTRAHLILSGLLYRDVPAVLRRYRDLRLLERKNRRGWSALLMKRLGA